MKVVTDAHLRTFFAQNGSKSFPIDEDTLFTPAAKDFVKEHGITLCRSAVPTEYKRMTTTPIPYSGGKAHYFIAETGEETTEKGESMTHLRGNLLVSKTHPRIAFRGKLDSLMAQMIGVQMVAAEEKSQKLADDLQELLDYVRKILAAEVKEKPLEEIRLLGMDSERIRYVSHHVKTEIGIDHPVPDYRMGRVCVSLNRLRTQVREAELDAVTAFTDKNGICARSDIVEALNRLSSCVYIIFCSKLAGYYKQENQS